MPDPTLAEVAADVAAALGLKVPPGSWEFPVWVGIGVLRQDGSNLTDRYWRCACEDWLHAQGYDEDYTALSAHGWNLASTSFEEYRTKCPRAEAPARLVSAIWRKRA